MSFEQFTTEKLAAVVKATIECVTDVDTLRARVGKLEKAMADPEVVTALAQARKEILRLEAELLNERENVALLNAQAKGLRSAVAALKTMKGMPTDLPSTDATCSPPPMTCYCAKCVHDRRSARMDDRG